MTSQGRKPGYYPKKDEFVTDTGQTLSNVHKAEKCFGTNCVIHNQSEWAKSIGYNYWRSDRGIMERICVHGIGHPDPDQTMPDYEWVHGCCGICCSPLNQELREL